MMYHVNEFTFTPRNHHMQVAAAYTADVLPEGKAVARQGNAIRIVDLDRPDVEIVVSRPWAEGDVFPLPLEEEDLSWAFDNAGRRARHTAFDTVPVSGTTLRWWRRMIRTGYADRLDEAAAHIEQADANPWVFAADWRHFEQFADASDWRCYETMGPEALYALMGHSMDAVDEALEEGASRL